MKAALFGAAQSGRKTLMKALLGQGGDNLSPGKKSVATVTVPDSRIRWLSSVVNPKKTTYAQVQIAFDDHPSTSLREMVEMAREHDILIFTVSAFKDGAAGAQKILSEIAAAREELIVSDLMLVEKRLEALSKPNSDENEFKLMKKLHEHLDRGEFLGKMAFDAGETRILSRYNLLTRKPLIAVVNIAEEEVAQEKWRDIESRGEAMGTTTISLCAQLEAEIASLPDEEQGEFLEGMGLDKPASHVLMSAVYRAMNLISFFTIGEKEVRAWPVRREATAPEAAAAIHSDIQRGFIRAEVVSYDDFRKYPSLQECKRRGMRRLEGKDYIVQEADIIEFLFKV